MTKSIPAEPADVERYTLLRPLGMGASGSVYLALDAETGAQVAVKKLFRLDPKSVQRFKREFRSLSELHHPNLVKIFDLQRGSDAWFLTMEYIDGVELRAHVLGDADPQTTRQDDLHSTQSALSSQRLAELLRMFHELADGVSALHRAGLLHRDLKPSNVVVARDGRVVVLDFGLIRQLDAQANQVTQDGTVAGTPAYMAPEQALGQELSQASDWYAFGVMLYEALSGHLPIDERNATRLLQRKLSHDPPPLAHHHLGVPRELADLCMQLLQRVPESRPSGATVLQVFSGLRAMRLPKERTQTEEFSIQTEVDAARSQKRASLIGRDSEVMHLMAALVRAREGQSVAVSVRGSSGTGKTALVEHFLEEAERERVGAALPLVLRSRCYERESMPFKALDGVVEALVAHLSKLDDLQVAHLVPNGLAELAQLFPTLQRLRAVQRLLLNDRPHPDAAEIRRRAERSLRGLIDNVAARQPVVLFIDDLQWGDLDSADVLRVWLAQPSRAPLLLILSYRSDELETSACLRSLTTELQVSGSDRSRITIDVTPLKDDVVVELCAQRVPADVPREVVARIVAEAGGNAFFVLQLTALARAKLARGELDLGDISIAELVLRTIELLPPGGRELLNVLAVAGRPLASHLALRAAEVRQDGRTLIHALQTLRLLRTRVVNGERLLEVYHDRVREAVQAAFDSDKRRELHDRLLRELEMTGRVEPDWLHELALGAGEVTLALRYGLLAAQRAHNSLAFERAIDLYQRCLRLATTKAELAQLWSNLARVLARSRRGSEAADAYLEAAKHVPPGQALSMLQLAASHLLRTGRFDEGEQLVQRLLTELGMQVPTSELGLYAAIAWERTQLALTGSERQRGKSGHPPMDHKPAEFIGMLAVETQFYAPLRAALFQTRALRVGIKSGDPLLTARALCLTATLSCVAGTASAAQRAEEQLARAEVLSSEVESHDLRSELFSARTVCAFLLGNMKDVLRFADTADQIYGTQRTGGEQGDYYYLFAVHSTRIGALHILGRYTEAEQHLRELLLRAEGTGNRTAILLATLSRTMSEQANDRSADSRPRLDRERPELPRAGIGVLHFLHLASIMRSACVTSEFDWALEAVDRLWEPCIRSPLRHGNVMRYIMHTSRARLLLNHYVAQGRNGDPAAAVSDDLRAMRSIRMLRVTDVARSVEARIAYLRGDTQTAIRLLRASVQEFTSIGLLEDGARDNMALGCLIGGEQGARMRAAAHATSLSLGIVNPVTLLRGSYPELAIDAKLTG